MTHIFEPSYTVARFCAAEDITPPTYYKLRKLGRGPREMRLGGTVRISHEARLDWHRQQENLSGEQAEAQRKTDKMLLKRARTISAKAVASPRHISKTRRTA